MDNNLIQETETEAQRLDNLRPNPGVEDGAIVVSPAGHTERILLDVDESNNVIGFHKEHIEEGTS